MKKKLLSAIAILVITISTNAQQQEANSVKGQINIDFFTRCNCRGFYTNFYFINPSYRAVNDIDLGLYYGRDFSRLGNKGNGHGNISGISLSYSFNRLVFKGNDKFDIYTRMLTGAYWYDYTYTRNYLRDGVEQDETVNYAGTKWDYNVFVGAKYYPVKWLGFMTEFGYQKYYDHWIVNFGLSFRIK